MVLQPLPDIIQTPLNLGNIFGCPLSPEVIEVNVDLIFGLKIGVFWNLVRKLRNYYYSVMEVVSLIYSWPIMNLNMTYNLPQELDTYLPYI